MNTIVTPGEQLAWRLWHFHENSGGQFLTTSGMMPYSEAGNKIIELAERIKAERSAATLNILINKLP